MKEENRYEELRNECNLWHAKHPEVWELFVKFTKQRIASKFKHYSAYTIFELIRWHTDEADTEGRSTFKVNNNFRPFYARRFMKKYPEHKEFFRLRVQTSKDRPATGLPPLGPDHFD
ncbi:MAG: hypothetical protein E4H01_00365 [Lysobacterales bacterium]|nr:MAG: hypothetical protein E4H01_00365 [Xanthomonadales bacterium]